MVKVNSYIKYPHKNITDLQEVVSQPSSFFVAIEDTDTLHRIKENIDWDYLDGCICLSVNQQVIMDYYYWDLVDQLWAYLVSLIEELVIDGHEVAKNHFPDQPIEIIMKSISENILLFKVGTSKYTLDRKEFFDALLSGAKFFFEQIIAITGDAKYMTEIRQIEEVQAKL